MAIRATPRSTGTISDKDRIFARYSKSQLANPTTNNVPIFYNSFNNYSHARRRAGLGPDGVAQHRQ